ncbi:MAG: hypothetical protein U1F54_04465 [Burkholderiales bacterium]
MDRSGGDDAAGLTMEAALKRVALAAGVVLLVACAPKPNEDVRVTIQGSHLVVENQSHADIHLQVIEPLVPFVPLSTPNNLLADGKSQRWRIPPSQRGQKIDVNWWRPGKEVEKGVRGPDRVRKVRLDLPPLGDPLPGDEAYVRACVALAAAERGRDYNAQKSERECMGKADALCPDSPARCAGEASAIAAALQAREEAKREQREATAAIASRDAVRSGALDGVARDAFVDLKGGQVDRYLAKLCEDTRKIHSGAFTRTLLEKTGQDFAQRKVELQRVVQREEDEVTFDALEPAKAAGTAPAVVKIKAAFKRENGKDCLLGLEEVR